MIWCGLVAGADARLGIFAAFETDVREHVNADAAAPNFRSH
jgi:hypothetical protein